MRTSPPAGIFSLTAVASTLWCWARQKSPARSKKLTTSPVVATHGRTLNGALQKEFQWRKRSAHAPHWHGCWPPSVGLCGSGTSRPRFFRRGLQATRADLGCRKMGEARIRLWRKKGARSIHCFQSFVRSAPPQLAAEFGGQAVRFDYSLGAKGWRRYRLLDGLSNTC